MLYFLFHRFFFTLFLFSIMSLRFLLLNKNDIPFFLQDIFNVILLLHQFNLNNVNDLNDDNVLKFSE